MESGGADGSHIEELMELTAQSLMELDINDRFNVIKEIGRGKYGHVLLVTHRCKGTPMALKVMPKAQTQRRSFLREYCTALTLSHPSIVALFGIAFESELHYCYAQELTGRDLLSLVRPKVGLPELLVKRCALQISSALEFVHGRGVVHRDVKPENVLLLDAGCSRVKLADFGLAQRRGALIRFISGTLPYMSPELCARVLRDGQVSAPPLAVEPSLDTWAFGVLLFCVLTGYFPWESCCATDSFYGEFRDWSRAARGENDRSRVASGENDRTRVASGENNRSRAASGENDRTRVATGENDRRRAASGENDRSRAATGENDRRRAASGENDRSHAVSGENVRNHAASSENGRNHAPSGENDRSHAVSGENVRNHAASGENGRNHAASGENDRSHTASGENDGSRVAGGEGQNAMGGAHSDEEEEEPVPSLWSRFSPDALQMFRRLMTLEPERRSHVTTVQEYLEHIWLKQTPVTEPTVPLTDLTTPPGTTPSAKPRP